MPTFGHFNLKFEYLITLGLGNMSIRSGICMFIYYYVWPKTPIYRVIKEKLADTRIRYVRLAYPSLCVLVGQTASGKKKKHRFKSEIT